MGYINLNAPDLFTKQVKDPIKINDLTPILASYIRVCDIKSIDYNDDDYIKLLFITSKMLNNMKLVLSTMTQLITELENFLIKNPQILNRLISELKEMK